MAGPWEKYAAEKQGTPKGPWTKFAAESGTEVPVEQEQALAPAAPDAVSFAAGREGVPTVTPPSLGQSIREYGEAITQPSDLDREALRVGATGVKQGLGALPNLAGDIYASAERGFSSAARSAGVPEIPGMQDVPAPSQLLRQGLDYLFQPRDYERPQTRMGQRAANVVGSGVAALTGPGIATAPMRMLGSGITSGIGAELGGEVAGTPGAIVGGIIGGTLPDVARFRTNARQRVFDKSMRGVNMTDLDISQQRMREAQSIGVDLSLPQAMPRETGLDEVQEMLTKRSAGAPLTAQLQAQPAQIAAATERQLGTLPGRQMGQQQIANIAQQQSDAALQAMRNERTAAVRPLYEAAGDTTPETIKLLRLKLKKEAQKYPNTETGDRLQELSNALVLEKPVIRNGERVGTKQVPITNLNQLNMILEEARSSLKRPTNTRAAADRRTAGIVSDAIKGVKGRLASENPKFKEAEELYAKMSREIVDPAKQGPVGIVAQRSGYDPAIPASRTNLYGIFDRGTAKGGRSDIKTLQRDMAKAGPEGKKAFADAGTSWLADTVQASFQMEGGKLGPQIASNLEKNLFGTPNQIRGVNDVLEGIALSADLPPETLKNGFQTWAQTVKLAAKRPSTMRQTSKGEIEAAAETAAGKLASTTVLAPYRRILERIDDFITKDAYGYMAKLLQSPEGVETLKQLSRAKPGSFAADTAIAKFNAIVAAQQAQEE